MIRVLSLDGGGARVLVQAMIADWIERETGRQVRQSFDFIGGTSAGGILALGLAAGIPALRLVKWYQGEVGHAFHRPKWHQVKTLRGVRGPKYPREGLEAVLQTLFRDARLSDLSPHLVTTFDLRRKRSAFPGDKGQRSHWQAWQAGYATGAAPTYFPPASIFGGAYIDGGVFANNPAPFVLREAVSRFPGEELSLLAIGNSPPGGGDPELEPWGWGLLDWARQIVPTFMTAGDTAIEYATEALLPAGRYVRVRPEFGAQLAMDDTSGRARATLASMAEDTWHLNRARIEEVLAA